MGKKDVLNILKSFKKALEGNHIRIERLILFGSWAKGTQQEGSDIDVVVISKDFENKDYWERIKILSNAIYQVFQPIEAVAMTPQEWDSKESPVCEFASQGEVITA